MGSENYPMGIGDGVMPALSWTKGASQSENYPMGIGDSMLFLKKSYDTI